MTTTLRHHSPLGEIAIVGARGLVAPDTDFELPDHLAARLLEQSDIFELVAGDPRERDEQTVKQLRHDLAERGLPYDGRKDDLVKRAAESDRVVPDPLLAPPAPIPPAPVEPPVVAPGDPDVAPTPEPAETPAPEPVDEPVDVVTDEPTDTEPATGQEGA